MSVEMVIFIKGHVHVDTTGICLKMVVCFNATNALALCVAF